MTMPRFEPIPATPASRILASLSTFITNVRDEYLHHRALKNDRAAFMRMAALDDGMLNDIGVTREDVAWAASLPLEVNAARAVRERTRLRQSGAGKEVANQRSEMPTKSESMSALGHLPPVVAARWFCLEQRSDFD